MNMEASVDPMSPGSLLDADHPENGVLIPCRFTIGGYWRSQFCFEMAHPEGESSKLSINSEDLFNTLKQWNKLLSAIQRPANDPEEDICGVAP